MGLLQPESGLLFWMTLAFAVVYFLLAKYGFPVILQAIESRKKYIDNSLNAAKEAEQKLIEIRANSQTILDEAGKQRAEILREATATREQILRDARQKADDEGLRIIAAARDKAKAEREAILQDARHQVAILSVAITEKILRQKLEDKSLQTSLAEKIFDEMEQRKTQEEA